MSKTVYPKITKTCSICECLDFTVNNKNINKILFGAKKYSICPFCGREVGKEEQTKEYKKRYNKFIGEKR